MSSVIAEFFPNCIYAVLPVVVVFFCRDDNNCAVFRSCSWPRKRCSWSHSAPRVLLGKLLNAPMARVLASNHWTRPSERCSILCVVGLLATSADRARISLAYTSYHTHTKKKQGQKCDVCSRGCWRTFFLLMFLGNSFFFFFKKHCTCDINVRPVYVGTSSTFRVWFATIFEYVCCWRKAVWNTTLFFWFIWKFLTPLYKFILLHVFPLFFNHHQVFVADDILHFNVLSGPWRGSRGLSLTHEFKTWLGRT